MTLLIFDLRFSVNKYSIDSIINNIDEQDRIAAEQNSPGVQTASPNAAANQSALDAAMAATLAAFKVKLCL